MGHPNISLKPVKRSCAYAWFLRLLALPFLIPVSTATAKAPSLVPKWDRFEQSFRSSVLYSNAPQEASLSVTFIAPSGETTEIQGFWDGGRTWRVRFSPNQFGRWRYRTACSDVTNRGLHKQVGEFTCTVMRGTDRLSRHGPVRVAADHRHLEHADGTPFFWLGDVVWRGAVLAQPADWRYYANVRARQNFTVTQWAVTPGDALQRDMPFTGREPISINPDFFQRLDARVETLDRAGLLNAIAPLWGMPLANGPTVETLPEDQAVLLLRYLVARWGAYDVAWILAFDGGAAGQNIARWKRIGRAVFGQGPHAPVILFPGEAYWVLDEFRNESWVDIFGYQTGPELTDDTLKWLFAGPFANDWPKDPPRPVINLSPPLENAPAPQSEKRTDDDAVRRAVYWTLLNAPVAGVSYGAHGVWNWDESVEPPLDHSMPGLPLWQRSLFLPGAKQMAHLAGFVTEIDFWRLRPAHELVASQPGRSAPQRFIAAARTDTKNLSVVYVPEDRTLEVLLDALPAAPSVVWINPRTGDTSPTVAVVSARTIQFPTPDPGDWLLVMKKGK